MAVHKPGYLNTIPDALSRGMLAPTSDVFSLSRSGVANLCNRLCIRGNVKPLDFSVHGPESFRVHAQKGSVMVGFIPHRMAMRVLRELLVLRRDYPNMEVAVCIPGYTYTMLAEMWGSLPRYYHQ